MDDKRIKLITTEMFIAWGMICMGFFVFDQITAYSHHCPFQGISLIARNMIFYTCVPVIFMAMYALKHLSNFINNELVYIFLFVVQAALFWYLGNLTGRFIVWLKHLRKKYLPESTTSPEPDK